VAGKVIFKIPFGAFYLAFQKKVEQRMDLNYHNQGLTRSIAVFFCVMKSWHCPCVTPATSYTIVLEQVADYQWN
jgi:hypothetical protein